MVIFLLACCSILECGLAGIITRQDKERLFVLLFLGIFCSVLFFAGLELYRTQREWLNQKIGNYKRFALCYGICSAMAVLFLFLPEFARPMLLLGAVVGVVSDPLFGMAAGILHIAVYVLCGQGNIFMVFCYLILVLCGCFSTIFLRKKEYFQWGSLLLFQFTFGSIMIFSYLQTGQLELDMLIYGVGNGIVSAFGAYILCRILDKEVEESTVSMQTPDKELLQEQTQEPKQNTVSKPKAKTSQKPKPKPKLPIGLSVNQILSEDFELYEAVKQSSQADYLHARKVSKIAENCARLVGADSAIAAAGGFYYRLGRMNGNPYGNQGVALAESYDFPKEVIEILREYNGEKKLPSTVESVVVHIADSITRKMESQGEMGGSSSWNQDMVIYQTLNENSASGLYAQAGFTMNMFLTIRNYLIKEAKMF